MPEDRLLWLPSVSILLSAAIFPHCEARRGSEAPLLLLLQTQGRAAEREGGERGGGGGGEVGVGWLKRRRGERGNTHTYIHARTLRERLRLYLVFP